MDQQDCLMITTLNKVRSLTQTAKLLYTSQPAVTYKLKKIEKQFGTKIFSREKSGLIPTPQGELIIAYAKVNLDEYNTTIEKIKSLNSNVSGTIKLGVASTYGQYILPSIINNFQVMYPDVNFKIYTGTSSVILDLLYSGKVHVGILRSNIAWNEHKKLLEKEPICIVSKNTIQLNNLPYTPIINYEMDTYLQDIVNKWWNEHFSTESPISMFVDSLETAKELVRTGLGYTILPGISLLSEKELNIKEIRANNNKKIFRYTHAYCRNKSFEYLAVKVFFDFLPLFEKEKSSFD